MTGKASEPKIGRFCQQQTIVWSEHSGGVGVGFTPSGAFLCPACMSIPERKDSEFWSCMASHDFRVFNVCVLFVSIKTTSSGFWMPDIQFTWNTKDWWDIFVTRATDSCLRIWKLREISVCTENGQNFHAVWLWHEPRNQKTQTPLRPLPLCTATHASMFSARHSLLAVQFECPQSSSVTKKGISQRNRQMIKKLWKTTKAIYCSIFWRVHAHFVPRCRKNTKEDKNTYICHFCRVGAEIREWGIKRVCLHDGFIKSQVACTLHAVRVSQERLSNLRTPRSCWMPNRQWQPNENSHLELPVWFPAWNLSFLQYPAYKNLSVSDRFSFFLEW